MVHPIDDLKEKEKIFLLAIYAGAIEGAVIGLFFGTYAGVKYNSNSNIILPTAIIVGAIISLSLAVIWTIVTLPWTKKNTDFLGGLGISAENTLIHFLTSLAYFLISAMVGDFGASVLSNVWR